ncbi:unnamed protein product [Lactuca virosa]|uniref:Cation-transporting P-type ATPase N-terminal domain-containing protein n=1 Tax=Lactuca virosa TaxID=75947 RepID=A0AAU9P9X1_9ASTR|nr:unnamed protein product [Lactuca virosa]
MSNTLKGLDASAHTIEERLKRYGLLPKPELEPEPEVEIGPNEVKRGPKDRLPSFPEKFDNQSTRINDHHYATRGQLIEVHHLHVFVCQHCQMFQPLHLHHASASVSIGSRPGVVNKDASNWKIQINKIQQLQDLSSGIIEMLEKGTHVIRFHLNVVGYGNKSWFIVSITGNMMGVGGMTFLQASVITYFYRCLFSWLELND